MFKGIMVVKVKNKHNIRRPLPLQLQGEAPETAKQSHAVYLPLFAVKSLCCAGLGSMTKGCCQGEDRMWLWYLEGYQKPQKNWQMPPYFPFLAFFPFCRSFFGMLMLTFPARSKAMLFICRESSCVCAGLGSMTTGCCQGEDRSVALMSWSCKKSQK